MVVTTLGEASRLGWRIKAHCLQFGPMAKNGHGRRTAVCRTVVELDMQTLIWTRGETFPLDMSEPTEMPEVRGPEGAGDIRTTDISQSSR
jgi:hypothetical protein